MNDNNDWFEETILWGGFFWEEEEDGTWTKRLKVDRFNGEKIRDIVEEGVSRKEYFARKENCRRGVEMLGIGSKNKNR